jgi:Ohr subfamily peroxiredoxin
MQKLYTTTVHATGDGRNGSVSSDCGTLQAEVRMPTELGGAGGATNPEMLFAAGYAACFHSALRLVAAQQGVDTTDSEVSATVALGPNDDGGFGLEVELDVSLPNADRAAAESAVAAAHHVCPYSNATRGNIDVHLSVV